MGIGQHWPVWINSGRATSKTSDRMETVRLFVMFFEFGIGQLFHPEIYKMNSFGWFMFVGFPEVCPFVVIEKM